MLPSEKTALGMAIQELEAPAAAQRKADGQRLGGSVHLLGVPGNTKQDSSHKTRDIAAANDEDEPEDVRAVARDVVTSGANTV